MLHVIISVAAAATSTGTVSLTATAAVGGDLSTRGDTVVLTRAGAVRRAMQVNPQIAAQRASELEARARMGQVDAAKYPRIRALFTITTAVEAENTDADQNGVRSRQAAIGDFNIDQVRPSFMARMNAVQPLTTFGKIGHRERAAEAGLEAAEAQTDMTSAEIVVQVADLYEAHVYAKDSLLFVKDIQNVASRAVQETEARLEVGDSDVKRGDLLRLKTALGAAQLAEHQARAAISQTREGLRAYLVIDRDVGLETEERYLDPVSEHASALEELIALARENRPEMRALRNGIEAYEALAAAERAAYYPNLFALLFFSGAYTPGRDFIQSRYVFDPFGHLLIGGTVGAQWNLEWNMASKRAAEQEAQARRLNGLLEWARAGVPAEVNRWHEDVQRARLDLKQLEETIPVTKEWVVRASADFSVGIGDSREVTDAVAAYVRMKNNQLQAVYRLNTALAKLAKATGTLTDGSSFLYPGDEE
jgi:outer membrane protein TolC